MKKIMFNDTFGLTDKVLAGTKTSTVRTISLSQWEKDSLEGKFDNNRLGVEEAYSKMKYGYGETVSIGMRYREIPGLPESFSNEKGWNNKMFVTPRLMPRAILVTNNRILKLNDLDYSDIINEGIELREGKYIVEKNGSVAFSSDDPFKAYAYLIDGISGKGTWDSNPYVVQYRFRLIPDNAPMENSDIVVINGVSREIDKKLGDMGYTHENRSISTSKCKLFTVCGPKWFYHTGFFPYAPSDGTGRLRVICNPEEIESRLFNRNSIK